MKKKKTKNSPPEDLGDGLDVANNNLVAGDEGKAAKLENGRAEVD